MGDNRVEPAAGIGDLSAILGLHVRLAHGAIRRHFTASGTGAALTQKQVSVLWFIGSNTGAAQTHVAKQLQIDRASVMSIVNHLQGQGLVERTPSTGDGRRQALILTHKGGIALSAAQATIANHEAWLRARFTAAEVTQLIALLTRIHSPK